MKKISTILFIIIILCSIPLISNAGSWKYNEFTNEMGDVHVKAAIVRDSDPDCSAMFGVSYIEDVGRLLYLQIDNSLIDDTTIEVKVDDNPIVELEAAPDGDMILAETTETLIYQLKHGNNVKVRVNTVNELYTIDFPLDNSKEAIDKIPSEGDFNS